jgi:hypothetical protein
MEWEFIQGNTRPLHGDIFKTKLCGHSPQANYTVRATAACQRSSCQLLGVEGVARSGQRIPTAVNLGFLDRSCYFFIQVAPQLSSRGWVDTVPDPLFLGKSSRAGNRTRDLRICSQKLWPLDHRGGLGDILKRQNLLLQFSLKWKLRKQWLSHITNLRAPERISQLDGWVIRYLTILPSRLAQEQRSRLGSGGGALKGLPAILTNLCCRNIN